MAGPHVRGPELLSKRWRDLNLTTTAILFCLSLAMFGLSSWRANRPVQFGKVRMIPWTTLIIVFAVIAIFMLVHLVNLLGFKTGQNVGIGR
jgi:uncharacterized membrane protein YhaH (DUF805 family)